jgi:hypothetical protein
MTVSIRKRRDRRNAVRERVAADEPSALPGPGYPSVPSGRLRGASLAIGEHGRSNGGGAIASACCAVWRWRRRADTKDSIPGSGNNRGPALARRRSAGASSNRRGGRPNTARDDRIRRNALTPWWTICPVCVEFRDFRTSAWPCQSAGPMCFGESAPGPTTSLRGGHPVRAGIAVTGDSRTLPVTCLAASADFRCAVGQVRMFRDWSPSLID